MDIKEYEIKPMLELAYHEFKKLKKDNEKLYRKLTNYHDVINYITERISLLESINDKDLEYRTALELETLKRVIKTFNKTMEEEK